MCRRSRIRPARLVRRRLIGLVWDPRIYSPAARNVPPAPRISLQPAIPAPPKRWTRVRKAVFPAAVGERDFFQLPRHSKVLPWSTNPSSSTEWKRRSARASSRSSSSPAARNERSRITSTTATARAPARIQGRHRDAPAGPTDRRHGPDQLRPSEEHDSPWATRIDVQGDGRPSLSR